MEKQKHLIVAHYHEIALKGKNRVFFERALVRNIERMLVGARARKITGRILVEYGGEYDTAREVLKKVFGIKHFSFARAVNADIKEIKTATLGFFQKPYPTSFRIEASRSEKNYPFTSQDLAVEVGAHIVGNTGIKVDLRNSERTLYVEVAEKKAYIYDEKVAGPGGLPVGVSGKVAALISSGFDSPVAALKMMKRGCEPTLIHFHSYPQTSRESVENVEKLAGVLAGFGPEPIMLHLVPFLEIQKMIIKSAPYSYAVIMYRRWMLKIAEMIAEREGAKALITGDSVGQVASQTLDNISVISEAVSMPILRPLAGYDKEEIINEARTHGTYEISKMPFDDCCNLFTSGSPETHGKIKEVKKYEDSIADDLRKLAEKALKEAELKMTK